MTCLRSLAKKTVVVIKVITHVTSTYNGVYTHTHEQRHVATMQHICSGEQTQAVHRALSYTLRDATMRGR